jgi:hypothetical protein
MQASPQDKVHMETEQVDTALIGYNGMESNAGQYLACLSPSCCRT